MRPKSLLTVALLLVLVAGTVAFGLARSGSAGIGLDQHVAAASEEEMDAEAKIENAMTAAPSSISADATILDFEMDDAGKFVVLREGSNSWSCFADQPGTPSNDPMCLDQAWMDWMYAFVTGEEPNTTTPGIIYMLQGGSDASNTDPLAAEPAEGEEWVLTPPHIMVIMPGKLDQTAISTDHHSGGPYIMWAGTPYEHIMVPIADAEDGM